MWIIAVAKDAGGIGQQDQLLSFERGRNLAGNGIGPVEGLGEQLVLQGQGCLVTAERSAPGRPDSIDWMVQEYQPQISFISEGVSLTVQAVISADRRYVRLSVLPTFTNITDVQTFTVQGGIGGQGGGAGGIGGQGGFGGQDPFAQPGGGQGQNPDPFAGGKDPFAGGGDPFGGGGDPFGG